MQKAAQNWFLFFQTASEMTSFCELNSKNYFSLMADGAADFGGTENETVVCCFVRDGVSVNCMLGHKAVTHARLYL